MKGLTFTTIAFAIIAMFAVIVLLAIFQSFLPSYLGSGFCKVYQAILSLPLPHQLKPSIAGCSIIPSMERLKFKTLTAGVLEQYIYRCWEKSEFGKRAQTFTCYELFIENVENRIVETRLNDILVQSNKCDALPNNYLDIDGISYNCGNQNLIYWKIGNIEGRDVTIIIKYDSFAKRLEVI